MKKIMILFASICAFVGVVDAKHRLHLRAQNKKEFKQLLEAEDDKNTSEESVVQKKVKKKVDKKKPKPKVKMATLVKAQKEAKKKVKKQPKPKVKMATLVKAQKEVKKKVKKQPKPKAVKKALPKRVADSSSHMTKQEKKAQEKSDARAKVHTLVKKIAQYNDKVNSLDDMLACAHANINAFDEKKSTSVADKNSEIRFFKKAARVASNEKLSSLASKLRKEQRELESRGVDSHKNSTENLKVLKKDLEKKRKIMKNALDKAKSSIQTQAKIAHYSIKIDKDNKVQIVDLDKDRSDKQEKSDVHKRQKQVKKQEEESKQAQADTVRTQLRVAKEKKDKKGVALLQQKLDSLTDDKKPKEAVPGYVIYGKRLYAHFLEVIDFLAKEKKVLKNKIAHFESILKQTKSAHKGQMKKHIQATQKSHDQVRQAHKDVKSMLNDVSQGKVFDDKKFDNVKKVTKRHVPSFTQAMEKVKNDMKNAYEDSKVMLKKMLKKEGKAARTLIDNAENRLKKLIVFDKKKPSPPALSKGTRYQKNKDTKEAQRDRSAAGRRHSGELQDQ